MKILSLFLFAAITAAGQTPNVIFIAVDDLRPDLGCYGEEHMVTPHIDSLASQGRMFRNHYVAVPTCGASRYALMSGLRPTTGTDGNDAFGRMPSSLPTEPESWVDMLRRGGWHTVCLGKITHEPDGYRWDDDGTYDIGRSRATAPDMLHSWNEVLYGHDKWGAQRYPLFAYADGTGRVRNNSPAWESGVDGNGDSLPDEAYPDGQMAQAAISKLREFADDGTRFCLAIGFHKPHLPFNAPKAYFDLYDPDLLPAPNPAARPSGASSGSTNSSGEINAYTDRSDFQVLRHAYFACISYVDAQVGKVMAELDALGLADETIVVLWGDHGWCLDDYARVGKHTVLERAVESPLIIRPPASLRSEAFAGLPATGVVETIDIYPTIAELCGLTPPASAAGSSLVPMLRNPFAPGKGHAFSRFGSLTSVRTAGWRLIDTNGTKDLYDLSTFRYEVEDVSGSHQAVVDELDLRLTSQGTRAGTSYAEWAGSSPLLADAEGDADRDGISNRLEYVAGTDALNSGSRPVHSVTTLDLTSDGLSDREMVFSFQLAPDRNDLALVPETSDDLLDWSASPLEFIEAGGSPFTIRFRLTSPPATTQFFRTEVVE